MIDSIVIYLCLSTGGPELIIYLKKKLHSPPACSAINVNLPFFIQTY